MFYGFFWKMKMKNEWWQERECGAAAADVHKVWDREHS